MKHVLVIACDYPPQAGTGTVRVTSLIRCLPAHGWQPIVLTTDRYGGLASDAEQGVHRAGDLLHNLFSPLRKGKTENVPQETQYLVATIPNQSVLGRLRDNVMVPDTKLGWLPGAVRLGRELIDRYHPAAIFSTSPPETSHLIACRLSRQTGVPWVMDMRDGWLFEPPNGELRGRRLRSSLEIKLERRAVRQASAVVTATAPIGEDLCRRYPEAASRVATITNGFDRTEYEGLSRRRKPDGTFLIVYTGSLSSSRQGTSAGAFFAAVSRLRQEQPDSPLRRAPGRPHREDERQTVGERGLSDVVTFVPPVSRREAHQHQLDADAQLLVTAPGQRSVATLKLFDYIGAGVPILALAHDNAAAEIVKRYRLGVNAPPDDPAAIATALGDLAARQQRGRAVVRLRAGPGPLRVARPGRSS